MSIFNNQDFYPTHKEAADILLRNLDLFDKIVLEPHGGKGDLIEQIKLAGAKEIITCEIEKDLIPICSEKADKFLKPNFLEVSSDEISHVDYIIANVPFSNGADHIIHMWEVCPEGCIISAFINYNTYKIWKKGNRAKLRQIIDKYGKIDYVGNIFNNAERKTDVEVGLVYLYKEKTGDDEFEDYLFSDEEEKEIYGGDGIAFYSKIRDIVGRYIQGVKMFNSVIGKADEINSIIHPLGGEFNINFSAIDKRGDRYTTLTRDTFKKDLQKSAWKSVFKEMNMEKYLTRKSREQINKYVEMETTKPFTEKNIYIMAQTIFGTHESRMMDVVEETFDWLTMHHNGNRYAVEGWKTNSMYMVNKKFIAPYCGLSMGYDGSPSFDWGRSSETINDLVKALCIVDGKNYDNMISIEDFFSSKEVENEDKKEFCIKVSDETGVDLKFCQLIHEFLINYSSVTEIDKWINKNFWDFNWISDRKKDLKKIIKYYQKEKPTSKYFGKRRETKEWGKWYNWNFFKIKVYKKGTMHCQFIDDKLWEKFNLLAVKKKGWRLPTKTGSDFRRKENGVEIY